MIIFLICYNQPMLKQALSLILIKVFEVGKNYKYNYKALFNKHCIAGRKLVDSLCRPYNNTTEQENHGS